MVPKPEWKEKGSVGRPTLETRPTAIKTTQNCYVRKESIESKGKFETKLLRWPVNRAEDTNGSCSGQKWDLFTIFTGCVAVTSMVWICGSPLDPVETKSQALSNGMAMLVRRGTGSCLSELLNSSNKPPADECDRQLGNRAPAFTQTRLFRTAAKSSVRTEGAWPRRCIPFSRWPLADFPSPQFGIALYSCVSRIILRNATPFYETATQDASGPPA
ncbi:hypothetical protein K0M31_003994 [Melipona bicolor]|uniref:Uncharacterized protein n=1 Tax=Melipona bicolor TaxID=60889 RepID=A0AA40KP51_9HYME|nr:hypothetical protein K0M31_003994 [Melipona bicolor]